ncbi:MAG: shikimate dehydrogenase [Candidatus Obscuribacterales bacterium]|nr:shikimate dehydrogenase [Candidatus Obscuribacterales bacterium]
MSPCLHEAALSYCGLTGEYQLLDTGLHTLSDSFARVKRLGFNGVNVTIPHKENIIKLLDDVSQEAKQIGAVNTIKFSKNGTATGFNTDVFGFSKSLTEALKRESIDTEWSRSTLVLGSGGAARAVVAGLMELGYLDISVFARTKEKGTEFVKDLCRKLGPKGELMFESTAIRAVDSLDESVLNDKSILINATPIGMDGNPPPDWLLGAISSLDRRAFIYDLVYSRLTDQPTPIESVAQLLGLSSIDGTAMLIFQALRAFEIWTGMQVPVDCMKNALARRCCS